MGWVRGLISNFTRSLNANKWISFWSIAPGLGGDSVSTVSTRLLPCRIRTLSCTEWVMG